MTDATVKLTAYNTNFETEAEFDAWVSYVAAHIDDVTGLDVKVDSYAFTGRGAGGTDDEIRTFSEDLAICETHERIIESALCDLWDRACADSFEVQS